MPIWLVGVAARFAGVGNFLKDISIRSWLIIGICIAAILLLWAVELKINAHFKHVKEIEASNASLLKANREWSQSYAQVVAINRTNEQALTSERQASSRVRDIANSEITLANTRATHYRDIRDAALRTKPSDCPVDPVLLDTVGRLWNKTPVSTAPADSSPK